MIKYEIITYTPTITIDSMQEVASSKEERKKLIEMGVTDAGLYEQRWLE